MKDEEFVFNQTVKERNKERTGARHKKNGSKSKKCTLPSDYMTKKEKEKMNGPITTYKIKGLTKIEFRSYPVDIRQMIVDEHAKHGARLIDIARHLNWGGCDTSFAKWCSEHGVKNTCKPGKKRRPEYDEWLGIKEESATEAQELPKTDIPVPSVPNIIKKAPTTGELQYSGRIEEIAANLIDILSGEDYEIRVCFRKKIEVFRG